MNQGAQGWLTVVWVVALGLLATLPIGIMIGSLVPGVQKVGTWGMLPMLVLLGTSGISTDPGAVGVGAGRGADLPVYWLGLGMRSAFLPEAAAALEIDGSWRTPQTVMVLTAWAVFGLLVAPVLLRRMVRRQSVRRWRPPSRKRCSGSGDGNPHGWCPTVRSARLGRRSSSVR